MRNEWHSSSSATTGWLSSLALLLCSFYLYSVVWLLVSSTLPVLLSDLEPVAITSGSMAPRIAAGDIVLNVPYEGDEPLARNEVVTFKDPGHPGRLITHRIVAINPDGTYRTRGDANLHADSTPLRADQVVGLGRALVPRAAMPLLWLDQRRLLPLAAWPVTTVLALLYVNGYRRTVLRPPGFWTSALGTEPVTRRSRQRRSTLPRSLTAGLQWLRHRVDWGRPIGARAAVGLLVIWALVAGGLVTGVAHSAFTESKANTGNSLQTAETFTPKATAVIGSAFSCAAASTTVTVPAGGVSAGSTLVVRIAARGGSAAAGGYAATDSRGNTYSADADAINGTNARSVLLSARITTSLAANDVITVTHPSATVHSVVVTRLTGIAAVGRVDAVATGTGGSNKLPAASITTVTQSTFVIGAVAANPASVYTSANGWTTMAGHQPTCSANTLGNFADYRLVAPAAHGFAPSLAANANWAVAMVAYKAADHQAPPIPTLSGMNGDAENTLSWTSVTDPSPPVTYQLLRNGVQIYSGTALTFNDTGVANGTSYTYVVRASDATGNQSGDSNAVVLTPAPGASIRFVKTIGAVTCGGGANTTSTVTVPAGGVPAGNTVVVRYTARESANASLISGLTVTDSRGNQYATDASAASSGSRVLAAVVAGYITTPLQQGDTISITSPTGNFHIAGVTEFSGIASSDRVIGSVSEGVSGSNVSLALNVTEPKVMVLGSVSTRDSSTASLPANWTALPTITATSCSNTADTHSAYRRPLTTGTQTYATTVTSSREKASLLLAYRAAVDVTPPPAPTLSGANGRQQNALSWSAVTDPSSPVTYQLARDGQTVYSGPATTFTDTGLSNGATYTYTVRATDAAGNQSSASNSVSLVPTPIGLVKQLGTRSCVGTGSSVTSQINVPSGGVAAGNTVLVRVVLSKPVPEAGPITATDSRGNTYTLDRDETRPTRVRVAILSAYAATALQNGDSITVTHPGAPATAVVAEEFEGIAAANRVNASAGANNQTAAPEVSVTTTVVNTLVYAAVGTETANRAHTPPGPPWTALGALVTSPCSTDNHAAFLRPTPPASYTYTAALTGGTAHWAAAAVVYRAAIDITPPPTPTLTGTPGNGHNDLVWTAVSDPSPPVTYRLYRDGQLIYTGTATSFEDPGLTNGVSYVYTLDATDGVGNTSPASNAVTLIPSPVEFVKEVARRSCGGTSSSLSVPPGGVGTGSTVLLRVVVREGSDTDPVTATDSKGNVYTKDADAVRPTKVRTVILSANITSPLGGGDTITVTHPAGKGQMVIADEFSGIAATNRVEAVGVGSNNSGAPSASVTIAADRTLLYGALGTRTATMTGPSGWNPLGAGVSGACTSVATNHAAYRPTTQVGAYSFAPTQSASDEWAAALVAYRSALDLTPPAVPVLSGVLGNTQNTLSWNAVTDPSGPVTYQLFRGPTQVYSGTATSFTDTGLLNGTTYTYTVRASDSAANQSGDSNTVTLIPSPIQHVADAGTLSCASGGGAITLTTGVAAGHTIIVRTTVRAGTDANPITVTDSKGNTYDEDINAVLAGKIRAAVFSARVTTPLAANDTITINHGSGNVHAAATVFSGIRELNRWHTAAGAGGSNATPSATVTTSQANTLTIGVVGTRANRTFNPPTGWTPLPTVLCAGTADNHAGWRITSTAGSKTYGATLTGGNDEWAAVLVAYRPE